MVPFHPLFSVCCVVLSYINECTHPIISKDKLPEVGLLEQKVGILKGPECLQKGPQACDHRKFSKCLTYCCLALPGVRHS